jgi:hypothetical protein
MPGYKKLLEALDQGFTTLRQTPISSIQLIDSAQQTVELDAKQLIDETGRMAAALWLGVSDL